MERQAGCARPYCEGSFPVRVFLSSPHDISSRQLSELGDLAILPGLVAVQLHREECCDPGSGSMLAVASRNNGARPARQHVLDGPCRLVPSRPGHFARPIG